MTDFLQGLLPEPGPDSQACGKPAPWDPYRALYLHLPFCKRRCLYCDFSTAAVPAGDASIDGYVEDLVLAIRRAGRAGLLGGIRTAYLGGGTPSHIGLSRLSMILYTLSVSMHLTPEVECTMEANPESLDGRMVRDIWALGVNRLSIGVQSFDDGVLRTLGRIHGSDAARRAIDAAQERFENVGIDLMCGIPGQSIGSFVSDIRTALACGVKHVSVYPLAIEEGTPFARMVDSGEMAEPDPDAQAEMMVAAEGILESAGMRRYEVASYAYPGFESRHNTAYWTGVPYLGLGASAVTMRQRPGLRQRIRDGRVEEELDGRQAAAEDLMLGMRMSRGISDAQLESASALLPDAPAAFAGLESEDFIEGGDGFRRPTRDGWLRGNLLYGRILELAP